MALALLILACAPTFAGEDERPTLTRFCGECHAGAEPKGAFALDDLDFADDEALWWRFAERIEAWTKDGLALPTCMPPTAPRAASDAGRWLDIDFLHEA